MYSTTQCFSFLKYKPEKRQKLFWLDVFLLCVKSHYMKESCMYVAQKKMLVYILELLFENSGQNS